MRTIRTVCHTAVVTVFALLVSAPATGSAAPPPAAGADAADTGSPAAAIRRDLGLSPEEYQRRADLAQQLASFAAAERQRFPGSVTGIWLDRAGRAVVAAASGTAEVRAAAQRAGFLLTDAPAPTPRWNSTPHPGEQFDPRLAGPLAAAAPVESVAGGDVYMTRLPPPSHQGAKCSWAFNAIDRDGEPAALTAGHCNEAVLAGMPLRADQQTFPWKDGHAAGPATGSFEKSVVDGIRDYSIVRIAAPARQSFHNNLVRGPIDGPAIGVSGVGIPVVGAPVCKSGSTTGFTCGLITAVDQPDPQRPPVRFKHTALSLPGDSGGALISGSLAMGIVSAGGFYLDPAQFPTDRPGVLPPAPPGSPLSLNRLLEQIGPKALQQVSPLVDDLLPYAPPISMIAQSVADVLAQNPGLQVRIR